MNASKNNLTAVVIAIMGTFLIMAALVYVMRRYTQPAPLGPKPSPAPRAVVS